MESIKYIAIGRRGIMEIYISIYIGLVAAISILILSIVFLYFNLHSNQILDKEVYIIVFFMLLLPSFLAVIVAVTRRKTFVIFYGIWLLPRNLYLSVAAISTLWNLYILSLMIYFIKFLKWKDEESNEARII